MEEGRDVGGIIGNANNNTTIASCYNSGVVEGKGSSLGGIAGSTGGIIEKCCNKGTVRQKAGLGNLGGIAGDTKQTTDIKVINNYNTGRIIEEVNNSAGVGGIVGWIFATGATGEIIHNYSAGEIEVTGTNPQSIGGVIGKTATNFTIDNNYYELNKSNVTLNNVGTGLQQSDMKIQQFVDQLNGSQTDYPWQIDTGNKNDGYPILNWQQ